jgi:hypothetical protein
MRERSSLYVVLLIGLVWAFTIFNEQKWNHKNIIVSDVLNYYAYLPALLIDQDLTFAYRNKREQRSEHDAILGSEIENGNFVPKMSIGAAILYAPFFLLAHWLSLLFGFPADGFSFLYSFFMIVGHLFYILLGLMCLRKILKLYFNEVVTWVTMITIAFCTNLFYYCTGAVGMPHSYSFCLFILFLLLTIKWHKKPSYWGSILAGSVIGLIVLIRPTNGIIALVFILYNVYDKASLVAKWKLLLRHWKQIAILVLFALLAISPQLIFWKMASGSFIYYSYGDEGFFFSRPKFIKGLFSYRKGWLLYTPIMGLALAGFYMLYQKRKELFLPLLIFTSLNTYIIFSWWCWWYGGGLGQRAMIESYALLALPLACFYNFFLDKKKGVKALLIVSVLCLGTLNLVQTIQYRHALHYDGMTKDAYWEIFFGRHGLGWPEGVGYRAMIRRPDYESALKGLQEYPNGENSAQKELDDQIKRIKRNKEWYKKIKKQSVEQGVPLDSALVRNARYILNN